MKVFNYRIVHSLWLCKHAAQEMYIELYEVHFLCQMEINNPSTINIFINMKRFLLLRSRLCKCCLFAWSKFVITLLQEINALLLVSTRNHLLSSFKRASIWSCLLFPSCKIIANCNICPSSRAIFMYGFLFIVFDENWFTC